MAPKILVLRFSSIGDIVLTTPVLRALQQQLGAEVHYLTKAAFASVLDHNPYIHTVWTFKKQVKEVSAALRTEKFDYIIDLHNNLRSRELSLRLGCFGPLLGPKVYRFQKLNWQKWLLTRWKINRLPARHIVDRYLAAAAPLGVMADGQGLDYFLPDLTAEEKNRLAAQLQLGGINFWLAHAGARALQGASPYLAFVVGAAHATKCLTELQQFAFCQAYQAPIVLLGGPSEKAVGERLSQAGSHVINTCGQYGLHVSAFLVSQAAIVLTHDTGLMHIAAAFKRPIVSIWGNTVPEFGMFPYLPGAGSPAEQRLSVPGLSCRPCSKIGFAACPKGHFNCIRQLPVAAIVAAVKEARATSAD